MSKSKCSVRVESSSGDAFTTRRGARRMIDAGLALFITEKCVRMVETHHAFNSTTEAHEGPALELVAPRPERPGIRILIPHGFLHYPQPGSFRRRRPLSEVA